MDCRVKPGNDGSRRFPGDCRIASRIVRGGGTVACRFKRQLAAGPVAQWLEPAAHNGLVAGSSPAGPTTLRPSGYAWRSHAYRRSLSETKAKTDWCRCESCGWQATQLTRGAWQDLHRPKS